MAPDSPVRLNVSILVAESEIFTAVHQGDLEDLKNILNAKQEKNPVLVELQKEGSTVIHLSAILGHLNILRWYKDKQVNGQHIDVVCPTSADIYDLIVRLPDSAPGMPLQRPVHHVVAECASRQR